MSSGRRLRTFETLENRMVLDGNVGAALVDGVLEIQGDNVDNSIQILQFAPQQFFVVGQDAGGQPTTVNGLPQFFFTNVTGFDIRLGHGDDSVFLNGDPGQGGLQNIFVKNNLFISGGQGSDNVLTENIRVGGNVNVQSGADNDFSQLIDSSFNGNVLLNGFDGNDLLASFRSIFRGDVIFNGGSGNDLILNGSKTHSLEGSIFRGNFNTRLGSGDNRFELVNSRLKGDIGVNGGSNDNLLFSDVFSNGDDISINTFAGNDILTIEDSVFKGQDSFKVQTGLGDDLVDVIDSLYQAQEELGLNTGNGNDILNIQESIFSEQSNVDIQLANGTNSLGVSGSVLDRVDTVNIRSGNGNDQVLFADSTFGGGDLTARTGDGNDEVRIQNLDTNFHMTYLFGNGDDQFNADDLSLNEDSRLGVFGGEGIDLIELRNALAEFEKESLIFNTGNGNDIINIDCLHTTKDGGQVRLLTGGGADKVNINNSFIKNLDKIFVDLGDGDDELKVRNFLDLFEPEFDTFLGGTGRDTLDALPPIRGTYFFDEFESFR